MKKMRFLSCLMAILMLVGFIATPASALGIHLDAGSATVYVDNSKVKNISAYIDGYNEIRVESEADMRKIFPEEMRQWSTFPTELIVTDWAEYFGYGWSQSDTNLYLYSPSYDTPSTDTPTLSPTLPDMPTVPDSSGTSAQVFVNGLKVDNANVHTYGGEFFINSNASLKTIFPKETQYTTFPSTVETSSLRQWATKYKYQFVTHGDRVYLNNDGNKPIEVTLDGKLVDFPDQQPLVVNPGRTMIPIRVVSELLDCTVEWDGANNRVIITKGTKAMLLWVNSTRCWIDGQFYDMDVAPYVLNGRTMVPARFITEAFGYKIEWDGSGTIPVVKLSSN